MDENKTQELVEEAIKGKLEEARMIGVQIGWKSAWGAAYEQTKDMTSAKSIKTFLKEKRDKEFPSFNNQSQQL